MATERQIQANCANAAFARQHRLEAHYHRQFNHALAKPLKPCEPPPTQLTTESKDGDFRIETNSEASRTQESDLERMNYALHRNHRAKKKRNQFV
jgi:hypothetical protein